LPGDAPTEFHSCTAQLIGDEGILLTAGHCLWDDAWGSNFQFDLQFNDGAVAQTFDWECGAMVSGWTEKLRAFDYALFKLRGAPVAGLGMKINVGAEHVVSVGYPGECTPTNPNCDARHMLDVANPKNGDNPAAMANNHMNRGASGGGWILADNHVVSVNSFFYEDDRTTMYGPELSATTLKVYEFARRSCQNIITVRPPAVVAAKDTRSSKVDEPQTLMSPVTDLASDAFSFIEYEKSDACTCQNTMQAFVKNNSKRNRLVGVQHISNS
jgi:hypothetical protein